MKIAVIVSEFNSEITNRLLEGCVARLQEKEILKDSIFVVKVPGAVEIPLVAQMLAQLGHYAAIIALGAVIRGETDHYEHVCRMVSEGCMKVSLEQQVPVIFGVLTTEDEAQALDRLGGKHGHKGKDAADAALQMVDLLSKI